MTNENPEDIIPSVADEAADLTSQMGLLAERYETLADRLAELEAAKRRLSAAAESVHAAAPSASSAEARAAGLGKLTAAYNEMQAAKLARGRPTPAQWDGMSAQQRAEYFVPSRGTTPGADVDKRLLDPNTPISELIAIRARQKGSA